MEYGMERRDFLKAATLFSATAAGVGMLAGCAPKTAGAKAAAGQGASAGGVDPATVDWDYETDVVIVGSGSSGTCAAIEAAQAGSDVVIFEKNEVMYGGNSALCGGYILAAGWSTQEELTGYAGDTGEAFAEQMLRWSQGMGNQEMIREACLRSADAVEFMMSTGRVYKGASVLPPVWSCGDTEADVVPRSLYNHEAFGATEGHMATLRSRVDEFDNVEVVMGAEVAHLVKSSTGDVVGVQLVDGSFAKARKGVVLACASVDNNTQMARDLGLLQQYWGQSLADAGLQNPGSPDIDTNTGDGVRMLREIGADLCLSQACCMNDRQYVGGISDWGVSEAMGHEPNIYESYRTSGAILVDRTGRRFCQDDAEWGYVIHEASKAAWRAGFNPEDPRTGYIWYLCDADHYWAFQGKGITVEDSETTFSADTIEGIADIIGCDADVLADEVATWNSYVEAGVDRDFGRKADLGTIVTPPFYCDVMIPGPMGSFAGAKTTVKTEVLGLDGEIVPRLYAAGAIAGGNWSGEFYFGCGWSILNTVVWGREAGQNVAALEPWDAR
ncbi:FAD-dependent oxidoreductase [Eggerthella sinensis]|uniref:FAD-dependent oxidoreductase n=1 Tax=Eggerthella sinensis TaxID=242230 RepID=UPI0022E0D2C4|nr:FAD-dependent oxidoreductase [Eggerthella sinensis]